MSSLATVNADSMLSDFSTSLLNVTVGEKEKKQGEKKQEINRLPNEGTPNKVTSSNNYNLSSVLSRIQDNGPAHDEKIKREGATEYTAEHNNTDGDFQDSELAEDALHLTSNKLFNGESVKFINRGQLLLLFVFSAVVIGVAMYTLDSQVKSSIEQSMQNINDNYSAINHNHEDKIGNRALVKLKGSSPVVTNDIVLITNSFSVLTNEIRSLRKELESVKGSIALNDANVEKSIIATTESKKNKPKNVLPFKKVVTKTKEASRARKGNVKGVSIKKVNDSVTIDAVDKKSKSVLAVSVASLSNEDKANKIIKRLDAAGLSPLLEEVVVKGKQLYRISVSGFTDLDEAKLFIKNASDKYGVKGSRIRKN
jgi:cell division septation protein DedD